MEWDASAGSDGGVAGLPPVELWRIAEVPAAAAAAALQADRCDGQSERWQTMLQYWALLQDVQSCTGVAVGAIVRTAGEKALPAVSARTFQG